MKVRHTLVAASMVFAVSGCGSENASSGVTPDNAACGTNVTGVTVDESELAGYPSYAVDGCRLVYVARASAAGAHGDLRVRDLTNGDEMVIAPGDEAPRRPTMSGGVIAWEGTIGGRGVVRVSYGGGVQTLTGPFDHAGEPRAAADGVVFTIWTTSDPLGDTDVDLYLPETGEIVPVVRGPSQQRFADISPTHVAFTDFSEDPDGRYDGAGDLADIGVYDRATHAVTTQLRAGRQAFPMLMTGEKLAYLHWELFEIHPEPKLAGYHLRTATLDGLAANDREITNVIAGAPPYVRPAAFESTLEWVDSPLGTSRLWRLDADASSMPIAVGGTTGFELYAPAPTKGFTVIATRSASTRPAVLAALGR